MKTLFTTCAICCFLAVLNLPIAYYSWLRILVSVGAIVMIYSLIISKQLAPVGIILFVVILIVFNPIVPVHLYIKSIWIPLDVLTGILFLVFAFLKKKQTLREQKIIKTINSKKPYTRDRIILPKHSKPKNN